MEDLSIFQNISLSDINKLLKCLKARIITIKKDHIIVKNMSDNGLVGVILDGTAHIIKYDYNGNRVIIENLEYNSLFGKPFSYLDNELSVIATSNCEILFLDYEFLMKHCSNNCECHDILKNNIVHILYNKISDISERIEILSKKSIKDKILCYLLLCAKKKKNNSFYLPLNYTELSDYLCVDRSALMREVKKLKNENIIHINGKKVTLNFMDSVV